MAKKITYKEAGVDIKKADKFIDNIKTLVKTTKRAGCVGSIGGFAALFKAPGKGMKEPLLVSSTDGVGTKLMVANAQKKHDTIGIDLVAMCVNDLICGGAEPLFFLDYFATGGLDLKTSTDVMKGIVKGCKDSNCAVIGGETAEMPGLYKKGDYDLAGFSVGVVDKPKVITGKGVKAGDVIIGLLSNGLHSNGFSLARKIFTEKEQKGKFGKELLKPTILYVKPVLQLIKKDVVKSIANITGGGFDGNIPRTLPKNCSVIINKNSWNMAPIFKEILKRDVVKEDELYRTFNMGIGMTIVVTEKDVKKSMAILSASKTKASVIGKIVKGKGGVTLK